MTALHPLNIQTGIAMWGAVGSTVAERDRLAAVFGFHPVNLAFRSVLEIAALIAIGVGSYTLSSGVFAWVLAIGLPLIAVVVWGTFNVPGDESRSGAAPIPVPGSVRLSLEIGVFALGVGLVSLASPIAAVILGVTVLIHYILSLDRIRWLLAH